MDDLKDRLKTNWRLEYGIYLVMIEDVNITIASEGKRPICWELKVIENERRLQKFHWIDKEGGVQMLITDLENLGLTHITPDNAINACNSLIGKKIEVKVEFNGEYQNITFLKREN